MATITRFVDTNSAGGDGTTRNHSGANAAYASLSAWEAAEQTNLVSDGDVHVVLCAGGADTTAILLGGWTTGASNDITIQGDPVGGDGKNDTTAFSTSFYHLTSGASVVIDLREAFVTFDGIQLELTGSTNGRTCIGDFGQTGALCKIKNSKFKLSVTGFDAHPVIFDFGDWDLEFNNNYVDWSRSVGGDEFGNDCLLFATTGNLIAWNNTMTRRIGWTDTNDPIGMRIGGAVTSAVIKNNAIFSVGGVDISDGITSTIDFNCLDDTGTGTNTTDMSPGTETTDHDAAVVDLTNGDFAIADTDSPMHDAGTATGRPFSTDQNGVSWETNDCGCFAFVSGGPAPVSGIAAILAPGFAISATGLETIPGLIALTSPFVQMSATGIGAQAITGSAAMVSPAVAMALAGLQTIPGLIGMTSPAVQMTAIGLQTIPGLIGITSPTIQMALAGLQTIPGIIGMTSPGIQVSLLGTSISGTTGSIAMISPGVLMAATGLQTIPGLIGMTSPIIQVAATGLQTIPGLIGMTSPGVLMAAVGLSRFLGTVAMVAPFVQMNLTGTEEFKALVAMAAPGIRIDITASGGVIIFSDAIVVALPTDLVTVALAADVKVTLSTDLVNVGFPAAIKVTIPK